MCVPYLSRLPWILSGSIKVKGAPGNIQGSLTGMVLTCTYFLEWRLTSSECCFSQMLGNMKPKYHVTVANLLRMHWRCGDTVFHLMWSANFVIRCHEIFVFEVMYAWNEYQLKLFWYPCFCHSSYVHKKLQTYVSRQFSSALGEDWSILQKEIPLLIYVIIFQVIYHQFV